MIPEWAGAGIETEVVTFREGKLFYPEETSPYVTHTHLGTRHRMTTLISLWRHLRRHPADAILSNTHVANVIVCGLKWFPQVVNRRILGVTNPYGQSRKNRSSRQRQRKFREVRRYYPHADGVIAVSDGIRKDLTEIIGLTGVDIHVIHNAVVTPRTLEMAREPVEHPWLANHDRPVVISAGRLAAQKDYPTLLRAFALLRSRMDARLIVLGEGPERPALQTLVIELGLEGTVDLPGFVSNPYAWIASADLFALSSAWEGFGNVLAEALSVGTPAVATDCPGGPGEILEGGRYGALVAPGDHAALAAAMEDSLRRSRGELPDISRCRERFSSGFAAQRYLAELGLAATREPT